MIPYYFVLDGKQAVPANGFDDPRVMALYEQDFDKRRVGKTRIGRLTVFTTFLVINHSFFGGPPLVFETMIQDDLGRWLDFQERYSTWEEAEVGHQAAIEWAKANPLTLKEYARDWLRLSLSHAWDRARHWVRSQTRRFK